jgi:hypothetical protein
LTEVSAQAVKNLNHANTETTVPNLVFQISLSLFEAMSKQLIFEERIANEKS